MFNLGPINSADSFSATWAYVDSLSHTVCDECGSTKWATSIRLGVIKPVISTDIVVAMRSAVEMTPTYLH